MLSFHGKMLGNKAPTLGARAYPLTKFDRYDQKEPNSYDHLWK